MMSLVIFTSEGSSVSFTFDDAGAIVRRTHTPTPFDQTPDHTERTPASPDDSGHPTDPV